MAGPQLVFLNGVPHISVGDAVALARMAHRRGASAEQYANALSELLTAPAPTPVPKPPKKKEKIRVRNKQRS